jgi:4-hydroxybenzoate polyprenyltransferase
MSFWSPYILLSIVIGLLTTASFLYDVYKKKPTKFRYFLITFILLSLVFSLPIFYGSVIVQNPDIRGWWPLYLIPAILFSLLIACVTYLCFYIFCFLLKHYSKKQ